jgi:ankyrin repeat protein
MNRIDQELLEAAKENNVPEVNRLLSIGADVNVKDINCKTPLHWAWHSQAVIELLDHGADAEAKNKDGWTSLHLACCMGHLAIVQALLSREAGIESKDNQGRTPLQLACCNGHLAIVKALVTVGADILAACNHGNLPIHLAVRLGRSEVAKYLLQQLYATTHRLPLHKLLEDLNWIGDPYMSNGAPPLREALHRKVLRTDDVVEIFEYLVDRNPAWLCSRDKDGSLPLHLACRRGASFYIVQSLVNLNKASVKSETSGGDLPLFLACEMPETSLDTIFLLMKLYPDLVYR